MPLEVVGKLLEVSGMSLKFGCPSRPVTELVQIWHVILRLIWVLQIALRVSV